MRIRRMIMVFALLWIGACVYADFVRGMTPPQKSSRAYEAHMAGQAH